MTPRARTIVAALILAMGAGFGGAGPASPVASAAPASPLASLAVSASSAPSLTVGGNAWVTVSVARLWFSPSAPWPVDAPALERPARVRTWLRTLSFSQRKALDVRSPTEALLGDRVVVIGLRPGWAKVVVPSQPTQLDSRGYPGWVPRRQLTARPPASKPQVATVTSRTAWLRTDDANASKVFEISFGTRLPVVAVLPHSVRVVTPLGVVRRLVSTRVVVRAKGEPARAPSRASLVSTAKSFLGLQYLWGGLSGFGLDCSGLTWLDYRAHGIRIPRDALPQSRRGQPVSTKAPGDLLFYASDGRVHHVSMYIGDGYMIHAPRTGVAVQIIQVSAEPLHSEYVGARRYLY
jgi:cell wall-associated NlpC family hydrolase